MKLKTLLLPLILPLAACTSQPLIHTEAQVDIPRYMGTWHVIAHIPAFLERNAWMATERYELEGDSTVHTTFSFREGAADGPLKTYHPTGFVDLASGGGLWGMQFIWPVRAEFRIVHVSPDYQETIIGRSRRDYVWIMARQPQLDDAAYAALVQRVADAGYDISRLRRVPQGPAR